MTRAVLALVAVAAWIGWTHPHPAATFATLAFWAVVVGGVVAFVVELMAAPEGDEPPSRLDRLDGIGANLTPSQRADVDWALSELQR